MRGWPGCGRAGSWRLGYGIALLGIALIGALPGCQRPNSGSTRTVELRTIDKAQFQAIFDRHRGKPILIDYWATWCGPCVELFPHTVDLQRRHGDRGLVVISLSLDEPENERVVHNFLNHNGAVAENYISQYGSSDEATRAFGVGGVPHIAIYDRHGKSFRTFAAGEPIDPAEVARAVEEVLTQ